MIHSCLIPPVGKKSTINNLKPKSPPKKDKKEEKKDESSSDEEDEDIDLDVEINGEQYEKLSELQKALVDCLMPSNKFSAKQ